jgi:uncharacterized SAM-binding protein YcdF (DUF218 family)
MAEIRYSGVPQKFTAGPGARTQNKWADFLGAELPQGLIKAIPIVGGGKRKALIAALMKLLEEEEKARAAAGGGVPLPGSLPTTGVGGDLNLSRIPSFDMSQFGGGG